MRATARPWGGFLALLLLAAPAPADDPKGAEVPVGEDVFTWSELPPIPDPNGLGGAFVGVSNDALIVAGGSNFPDGRPWDGAEKVWHDRIYILTDPSGEWRTVETTLPRPLAYGNAVSTPRGLLCIGGADGDRHYADVFLLRWDGRAIEVEPLPPLPEPLAYSCGAMLGPTVYVCGGTSAPDATEAVSSFSAIDLEPEIGRGWRALPSWPGPERMLAAAGVQDGGLYLIGGARLKPGPEGAPDRIKPYLSDAYRYRPGPLGTPGRWDPVADLPGPRAAMPGPAPSLGVTHLAVLGGDDGRLTPELRDAHPGFTSTVWTYHTVTDTWTDRGSIPRDVGPDPASRPELGTWPPVTTGAASWRGRVVIPSGEVRPGVRSARVLSASPVPPRSDFRTIDYGVLGGYLLGLAVLGAFFARRERGTDDFFLGGRRVPWWAAGVSIFGTQLSAITFLAIPAKAYATDWVNFPLNLGIPVIAGLAAVFYLPFFRRLGVTTAYEYLEHRFHLWVRLFASVSFVAFQVGRMAIVLVLPSLALAAVTGLDLTLCIVVMGVLTTAYTALGGIEAVIWTDVLQVVVLGGGAVVALAVMWLGTGDGAFTLAAELGKFRVVDATSDWTGPAIWVILLGAVFQNLMPYTADQAVVQRYLTPPDERGAARAIWAGGLLSVPSALIFFGIGTALFAYYRTHPERLGVLASGDQIFAWFIVQELPAGLSGLLVAAVFAAAMSSLDSGLNSVAAAVTTDFYRRFLPTATDRSALRLARILTVGLGVVVTLAGVWLAGAEVRSLWDAFFSVIGLLGGTMAGLFALGIFSRRANAPGAAAGIVVSSACLIYIAYFTPANNLLYVTVGVLSCVAVGWLASLPFGTRAPAGLTAFDPPRRPDAQSPLTME